MKLFIKLFSGLLLTIIGGVFIASAVNVEPSFVVFPLIALGLVPKPGGVLMITWADIAGLTDGEDNMGGTQLLAYYIPADDIQTFPDYAGSDTLENLGKITDDFTLKAGKYWKELYATPDSGMITDNKVEGNDHNTHESVYEFFLPGNKAQQIGFARAGSTAKMVVIVLEANNNRRVLGIKQGFPAMLTSNAGSTGKSSEAQKGMTIQIKSFQNGPAPIYEGSVPLDGSTSL